MAWLSGYSKRKPITITGGASGAQTDFQLKLAVSKEAAMDGEFDDIRFTQADGTTLVDAWAEVIVTDTSATVWVEFPTTPANTVEQTYYMYYGNAAAASDWDGAATFPLLFDDFEDALQGDWTTNETPVDYDSTTDKWAGSQSMEVGASADRGGAKIALTHSDDIAISYRMKASTTEYMLHMFGDGDHIMYIRPQNNLLQYYDDAGLQGSHSMPCNNWYKLTLKNFDWAANTYDICEDDAETLVYNADMLANTGYVDYLNLYSNGVGFFDNVYARKYTANPPTYAFGAEQSVPTGIMPVLSHLYNQMRQ